MDSDSRYDDLIRQMQDMKATFDIQFDRLTRENQELRYKNSVYEEAGSTRPTFSEFQQIPLADESPYTQPSPNQQSYTQPAPPPHVVYYPHPPAPSPAPDLNLPLPPMFSGKSADLQNFRFGVTQHILGSPLRYHTTRSKLILAGNLLDGMAKSWFRSVCDPVTAEPPTNWTLADFFQELDDTFGGGEDQAALERRLHELQHTGSVAELSVRFRDITNTFQPRWTDHSLIFNFKAKLKPAIQSELARSTQPPTFSAFVKAAGLVETNLANSRRIDAATRKPPYISPSQTSGPTPSYLQEVTPMELDGTRRKRLQLESTEYDRRKKGNLCMYCGGAGHNRDSCPAKPANQARQVRFLDTSPDQPKNDAPGQS